MIFKKVFTPDVVPHSKAPIFKTLDQSDQKCDRTFRVHHGFLETTISIHTTCFVKFHVHPST